MGWYVLPPAVRLHHIDDRLQHQTLRVVIGVPDASHRWQQRFQATPDHLLSHPPATLLPPAVPLAAAPLPRACRR
jgi:hypothetical protein